MTFPTLTKIQEALEELGLEVWEPFKRNAPNTKEENWIETIGRFNARDVEFADAIFAVINGCPPDEGVCWELGYAAALKKPTFIFRDDFRRCSDSDRYPANLMLFIPLFDKKWEDYYYTSVEEITSKDKALYRFANEPIQSEEL